MKEEVKQPYKEGTVPMVTTLEIDEVQKDESERTSPK